MENKNTFIAIVLMLVVWIGFTVLFPPQERVGDNGTARSESASTSAVEAEKPRQEQNAGPSEPSLPPALPDVSSPAEGLREVTIETDTFQAVFTNSGARLKSFQLKDYTAEAAGDSAPVSLVDVDTERLATLRLQGTDGLAIPADLRYAVSLDGNRVAISGDDRAQLVFTGVTPAGLQVEKIYTLGGDRYDFGLQTRVTNTSSAVYRGSLTLSLVQPWDDAMAENRFDFVGPATLVDEEVQTDSVEDLAEESRNYQNVVWTAFEDKYFISAVVPLQDAGEKVRVEKSGETVVNTLETPYATLGPGERVEHEFLLYFGPRDLDILKGVDHQLDRAIDFGFFSLLALPLRHVLTFFYQYVGNYGVAIILLTVIIKALFWPLTQKSYSSMKAMQKLQPEMAKIRERFKNDRERMNREIMEMYKKHRVNPLGGCLPMLIQIPVFFALYKVLLGDIALRQAPFALWITDLSAKDPYYITPIIMGATMVIQQKLTPSTMDPTQAKMFMLMPVVFTFLFLNFPAGLVIYWLTNNLLTIAQQVLINRKA